LKTRDWQSKLIFVLVGLAAVMSVVISRREVPPLPSAGAITPVTGSRYTFITDVAGWYQITPNEAAVESPFGFALYAGAEDLPLHIGNWWGEEVTVGREIDEWLETPEIALRRTYVNPAGQRLWLSVFGSRGEKSYRLFEHTPVTSYPAAGWTLLTEGLAAVPSDGGNFTVQRAILTQGSLRRLVYFWYLWKDPQRNPEAGLLTVRLHADVADGNDAATEAAAQSFLRLIFPRVLPWHRF